MKKNDIDIRDIYNEQPPKFAEPTSNWSAKEAVDREIRRRLIVNASAVLITILLTVLLLTTIAKDFLYATRQKTSARAKPVPLASYTLPEDEQWAVEYRQVATQAEANEPLNAKEISTKWVKNTAYHLIMGEQALRQNELESAQNHLETAITTFPGMTGVHRPLGSVYLKQQYFEKAVEQLQKALEEQTSIDVLNNLGVAYMGIREYDRAETYFKLALQQQPDLAGCYKNLALLYQQINRTNEASASFEKYFSLNPTDTVQIKNYVDYLTATDRTRDAIDFLERPSGADPLIVYRLLAKTAAQAGDAELAVKALKQLARLLTPRQTIAEMHDVVFDKIANDESFEDLLYKLELAAVSLSTNFQAEGKSAD
jgi:tetratricopeptide (TPR) repeat protein